MHKTIEIDAKLSRAGYWYGIFLNHLMLALQVSGSDFIDKHLVPMAKILQ
jgi:hypothetical protein